MLWKMIHDGGVEMVDTAIDHVHVIYCKTPYFNDDNYHQREHDIDDSFGRQG
jgi:hypothetical protein